MNLEEQYDKIFRYLFFHLHDMHTAEDLTQETFLRFLKSRTYQDEKRQLQYLYTIARNLCRQYYRDLTITDNAAVYPCRHCLCGLQTAFALFASSLQTVVRCRDNLPPACENLPQAALSQLWTMLCPHRPFSFAASKETKPPLAGGQKGRE